MWEGGTEYSSLEQTFDRGSKYSHWKQTWQGTEYHPIENKFGRGAEYSLLESNLAGGQTFPNWKEHL